MDHSTPIAPIAIIGDGAASLACFAALRQQGVPSAAITVYGDSPHPLAALECYARALRQHDMRSEGNGHLDPIEFPGLALVDAWRNRTLWPLLRALIDHYTPPLALLRVHTDDLVRRVGFAQRRVHRRVHAIHYGTGAVPAFVLAGSEGAALGSAQQIILALGAAGLAWPIWTQGWQRHPAVVHAYQCPQIQPDQQLVVIGQGMAAAHIWVAALRSGARVTAIHRRPLHRQTLNAPRCAFSLAGIAAYQQLNPSQRRLFHQQRPSSFPRRWRWEWLLHQARRAGRFTTVHGEVVRIAEQSASQPGKLSLQLSTGRAISADQLVCATGFERDACAHPLIRQMVEHYDLPVVDGMLGVADDFTLPRIGGPHHRCGVVGALAGWALPIANTFVGMKYVARRLVPMMCAASVPHDHRVNFRDLHFTAP